MRGVHLGPSLSATYSGPKAVPSLLSPSDLRWTLSCTSPWTPPYLAVSDLTSSPFLAPMSPASSPGHPLCYLCITWPPSSGPHLSSAWKVFLRLTSAFMELSIDYFLGPPLSGPQASPFPLLIPTVGCPFLVKASLRLKVPSQSPKHISSTSQRISQPISTAIVTASA